MSACTGGHAGSHSSTPSVAPSTSTVTHAVPAAPLALRVDLETTTAHAGQEIRGILWFTNNTTRAIATPCPIVPGLANSEIPFVPTRTLQSCSRAVLPGVSRLPIGLATTYWFCTNSNPRPGVPRCGPHGAIPALPAGRYHVVVVGPPLTKPLPQPPAVTVVVT